VAKLVKANNLSSPNLIVAGKKLRIPGQSGGGGGSAAIHVVRSGETLSGIASRYGMTLKGIARRNKIANVSVIRIGQRLKVRSGGGSSNRRAPASTPSRATVGGMIHRHAVGHGVNPALAKAVAWQESGWRQNVVSSAGAIGVMQVMPGTADYVNKSLGHGNLNVRKADDNIHLGVAYLAHMLRIMPNERKALAAYYSGPGNVGRKLNRIQRPYVRSVRALKRRF
jgi:soluble lytic murein transglycosylase-like protein